MREKGRIRSLLTRLRWDLSDEAVPSRDRAAIARTFIYLYGLGATLVLFSLVFTGEPDRWEPGILGVVVAAYAVSLLVLIEFDRLPQWFFYVLSPAGTLLVSVIIASAGAGESTLYATLYFWAVLSASAFFSTRVTVLNLAWVAVCYAAVLAFAPNVTRGLQDWVMVVATVGVLAAVMSKLRGRSERLLDLVNRRSLKQARVAELGRFALSDDDLPHLARRVVEAVVEALNVERAAVFSAPSGEEQLLVRATAGYGVEAPPAISLDDPVVAEAFGSTGAIQRDGTIAVAIRGAEGPVGLLVAYGRGGHEFERSEAAFLQSVAHVIGEATERQRVAVEREHLALHDHLTGRPNRTLFTGRLDEAIVRARDEQKLLAVYFLDLDDFKLINDGFGHGAGDDLLKALGPRLREALVMTDTVARFGGDEFAVLCEDVEGEEHAIEIARRLRAVLDVPFEIGDASYRISASIGIVVSGGDSNSEELIAHADAAMYRAKERTRGGFEFFDGSLRDRMRMRLEYESALQAAADEGQLSLAVQPIVALPAGEPVGSEALLRWTHPELGSVSPAEFIPIAEQTGAIMPLGEWVIHEALELAALWRADERRRYLPIHVNVSARQLAAPDFLSLVAAEFERTGARRRDVSFEITEHALISEKPGTVHALKRLQETGSPIVLDDFGTGYSSLSHLKRFPIDVVKVDRSFVSNLTGERRDQAIVAAVVGMADAFALDVVAEGIETAEQADLLTRLGCRFGQGYLFARPAPARELESLPLMRLPGAATAPAEPQSSANPAAFKASSTDA
jgi:diguanylate cyclase (GGDEF)-like protein